MFEGYLELGGTEVLNSARTVGYTETAPCPIQWLRCPPCVSLNDALNEEFPYNYATISEAPWYDADDEATHRFLGAYAISMEGITDSTREADVQEGITDGGVVGRVRNATRRIRVRAMLSAIGEDALEAGFSWLEAALGPNRCSTHGGACGSADMSIFAACPPARSDVTTTDVVWNSPVVNLITNPRADNTTTGWTASSPVTRTAQPGGLRVNFPTALADKTEALYATVTAALPGQSWYSALDVTVPAGQPAATFTLATAAYGSTVALGSAETAPVTIQPGATVRLVTPVMLMPAGTTWAQLWLNVRAPGVTAASHVTITRAMLQQSTNTAGDYFDGSTPDSGDESSVGTTVSRYEWTGTANASTSTREDGQVIGVEDPVEYERLLSRLIRNIHTVTCVSGPIVEQKLHRGEAWGYVVEFILVAGTPWVFGETMPVALSPSVPDVIQDVPFNLVPYPSAELALPAPVITATNYSINPSVEVNITGWTYDGTVSPQVVTRTTELSSSGVASARSVFTAAAAGTNGWMSLEHSVDLPAYVAGSRISFNEWAAANIQSGTAVLGTIDIIAIWFNGATYVTESVVGSQSAAGGALSYRSMVRPAGTTRVVMRAKLNLTSWSSGAVIRLYADAVAVTVP